MNNNKVDNDLKIKIIGAVSDSLDVNKGIISSCYLLNREKISLGNNNLNYICVIEDSDALFISNGKEKLSKNLNRLASKIYKTDVIGEIMFEKKFDFENFSTEGEDNMPNLEENNNEFDYVGRSKTYVPVEPKYTFDRVILDEETKESIEDAISTVLYEKKVFEEWGLKAIEPNPCSAIGFFGPSGTGKTMCAEAVANKVGKKILKVSYADIESKYHGEGPKMVKAIFLAAENNDAVLFIDEADSLLSKRLTNVTQGSEQAINSMRSQLLICLEEFKGIVIFATNLIRNYDNAFLTRLISIEFKLPGVDERKQIWDVHLFKMNGNCLNIPLAKDVDTKKLAEKYEFVGRDIRKAVINACVHSAKKGLDIVCQQSLIEACDKINKEKESVKKSNN